MVPPLVPGCAVRSETTGRLTPFREDLHRIGALRDARVDGRRYCLVDMGEGPPIVLLHGLGGSLYDWRHLLRPLSERRRVIALDLLGAGESEIPDAEDFTIAAQARRVRGILDHLRVGRCCLVGNSYGGGIALKFSQDWPERVTRMVLLNTICYPERIPAYVNLARMPFAGSLAEGLPLGALIRRMLRAVYRTVEKLSEEELNTYVRELGTPRSRRAIVRVLRDVVPRDPTEFESRLKTIDAPTLLLWGTADRTLPVALGRRLALDLPNARLVEVDAGHVPNQECPDQVLKLMMEFLE
jgi:pimeloyl-ACP methyl ester carboxylesterase